MGIFLFPPSTLVLRNVRRIRAGMKPPPPIAMKRVGSVRRQVGANVRVGMEDRDRAEIVQGETVECRVRRRGHRSVIIFPKSMAHTKLGLDLDGSLFDRLVNVVVAQSDPERV
jgi:hypothetical protein